MTQIVAAMHSNGGTGSSAALATKLDRLSRCLSVLEVATRRAPPGEGQQELPSRITLDMVRVLLFVASNPLQSVRDIAASMGQPLSTTSRQLLDLGPKDRHLREGFGMVEAVADPIDMRIKRYRVTEKGREIVNKMAEELR